jgi:hypothetical protein
MPSMARRDSRERGMWGANYGPLAGWLAAVTGDQRLARAIADETFLRIFSRWSLPRCPRRMLYVEALRRLEQRHGAGAWEPGPDGWLGDLVRGLPPIGRRAVLLHRAGLGMGEVAGVLHIRSAKVVSELLVLAEPPEPEVLDLRLPEPRAGEADVSPESVDERVASVN